jgi:hypothetical protein
MRTCTHFLHFSSFVFNFYVLILGMEGKFYSEWLQGLPLHVILIFYWRYEIFELDTFLKNLLAIFTLWLHTVSWGASYPVGTRGFFHGGVRLGREANHSPPSIAEVKEWVELYLHSPITPSWRGAQLKRRDNFVFTFYLLLYPGNKVVTYI